MKSIKFNRTRKYSIFSAIILGVFVWFAVSSIPGFYSNTGYFRTLEDGIHQTIYSYDFGRTYIKTGKMDKNLYWQGQLTAKLLNVNNEVLSEEVVNMVDDKRHGISITTYKDGRVDTVCYNMGEIVDCETEAAPASNKESASDILFTNNPETVNELTLISGFNAAEIQEMADTMQIMMEAMEFDFSIFDTIYQDVQEELLGTRYDSIVAANAELSFYKGIELSKYDEFRIAVINRYLRGDNSLMYTLEHIHSNYINLINSYGYTNLDLENFCFVFDSLMLSNGPLNLTDPYLVDSLDNRMVRALLYISGYNVLFGLKSLNLNNKNLSVSNYLKYQYDQAKMYSVAATPMQVAQLVVGLVYYKYIEGDRIRKALMEAYAYQKGIVLFPTVTTVFQSRNSSSSVTISGNVTDDGGGEIITRGFVWGKVYNPNYRDNVIAENPGTGNFQSEISGLTEGETYYVRSFATNSAGTQYGNCVEFTTNLSVSAEVLEQVEPELNVYPNPTSGVTRFSINVETSGNVKLSILNINGQVVLHKEIGNISKGENMLELNLSNLENGIYTGTLTIDKLTQLNRKFIVAH